MCIKNTHMKNHMKNPKEPPPNVPLLISEKSLKQNSFIFSQKYYDDILEKKLEFQNLDGKSLNQLRGILRKYDLSTKGSKPTLIKKLNKFYEKLSRKEWLKASKPSRCLNITKKYREIFFTWLVKCNDWLDRLLSLKTNKHKFQRDLGHLKGYLHIQGVLIFENGISPLTLINKLPGIFIEKIESIQAAAEYCSKLDSRIGKTYSKGFEEHFEDKEIDIISKYEKERKDINTLSGFTEDELELAFSECCCGNKCKEFDRCCDTYSQVRNIFCWAFCKYKGIRYDGPGAPSADDNSEMIAPLDIISSNNFRNKKFL